jgi:hypothetical protein
MSPIFNYINSNNIYFVTDYNDNNIIHTFENVLFRTHNSNFLNFHTPIGIYKDKVISITNKQLSYLIQKYIHFIGHEYASELKNTYNSILCENNDNIIKINDEVLQFFDYESISGTGHSYDLMFYLLYHYFINHKKCKLLVVESNNKYYNNTLLLIKNYFTIEYFYIKTNKTYLFKKFNCIRSYQNIFFNEVKEFINLKLIYPIIQKYEKVNTLFYDNIIKIKLNDNNDAINRLKTGYDKTDNYNLFLKRVNFFDLNDIDQDEELKIFLLNKAKNIIVSWGSLYYININYYLITSDNTFINILFLPNYMTESNMLVNIDTNHFRQNMPTWASNNYTNQVYNLFSFKGKIYYDVSKIDDFIEKYEIEL